MVMSMSCVRWTFAKKKKLNTCSSVFHSHTVLIKLCPCGRYRQPNLVLYHNGYILNLSKIIFNGIFLKEF